MSTSPNTPPDSGDSPAKDWQVSAAEFITARIELVSLEMRDAGHLAAKKGALAAIIACAALFCWLLVTAGLIGLISALKPEWPWYGVTLGFGLLYFLIALSAYLLLRKPYREPFAHTRSELEKDRECLHRLSNDSKSTN